MKEALLDTIRDGGQVLWVLLALAAVIYALLASSWAGLRRARRKLGEWKPSPAHSPERIAGEMAAFELDEIAWVQRRIPFVGVLVAAAPLLGLLGTVAGMLKTFSGLASAGGPAPIESASSGISQALVTTQAGLVAAIPAAFCLALLHRQVQQAQLELWRRWHETIANRATPRLANALLSQSR
jgi:biopolymer transport protein ExbB/TolQ